MSSKRGSLYNDDAEVSDINISPMIDMLFSILLIFFHRCDRFRGGAGSGSFPRAGDDR